MVRFRIFVVECTQLAGRWTELTLPASNPRQTQPNDKNKAGVFLFTHAEFYCLHMQSIIVYTYRVLLFSHAEFYCLHMQSFIVCTCRVLLFAHEEFYCLHMQSFIVYTCRVLLFIQNSWLQRSAQG